jgi:small subunit ribosomal protein S1
MPSDDRTSGESFAALFEAESKNKPRKAAGRGYAPGEPVEGVVVRIGRDAIFLDLDGKREGYLELAELQEKLPAIGDTMRATVVKAEGDGAIKLARTAPKGRGTEGLQQAREAGLPVEGVVSGINKGGLEVTIDGVRAFCPARQVDLRFVADLNVYVGQRLSFLVTQVKDRDVVLSRRAYLEREQHEARAQLAGKLVVGAVLRGRVTNTRDFGAFVDLGGVEALLPASELSHDRTLKPADVVKVGDELEVQILEIGADAKRPGEQRITLSLKALSGDPWDSAALEEGAIREGRVVRVAQFGAFVQLAPGLDGLLHVSEVGTEAQLPKVGDVLSVRILKIDREQRRIGLQPAEGGRTRPARGAAPIGEGQVVSGKVSGIERFGIFVQIDGGGRGLIPAHEVEKRGGDLTKLFPIGSEIRAKIVSIDPSGKIRLSIAAAKADDERATFEDYRAREADRSAGKMGSLGAKLQAALKKK